MATITVSTNSVLSDLSYVSGDTISINNRVTLTINSSFGTKKPRDLLALGSGIINVVNSSTTTPILLDFYFNQSTQAIRVEQNAKFLVSGNWIQTATGTGSSKQTVLTANNVNGVDIDYPTKVQVETGNGTGIYEDWIVLPEQVSGGEKNKFGFNRGNTKTGTVTITSGGVVTGTGTSFVALQHVGSVFRATGHTRDFIVSAVSSSTSMTIVEKNGSTYTGGAISVATNYEIYDGQLINRYQVTNGEIGKVLFFNPLTTVVTCGDGTNGNVIPTGAKVRIPNIYIITERFSTTTTTAITSTAAQSVTLASGTRFAATNTARTTTNSTSVSGSFLFVSGSTYERIHYATISSSVISATGMLRGDYGTTAQSSFPIGTTVYWVPANSSTVNISAFDSDAGGYVDIDCACFGLTFFANFSNFSYLKIKDVGAAGRFQAASSSGSYSINGLSVLSNSFMFYQTVDSPISCFALLGVGSIKNTVTASVYPGVSATSYVQQAYQTMTSITELSSLKGYVFCKVPSITALSIPMVFINFCNSSGIYNNFTLIGGCLRIATTSNAYISDINYSDTPAGYTRGLTSDVMRAVYMATSNQTIIRGIKILPTGSAPRPALFEIESTCTDCVVSNKGYPTIDGGAMLGAIVHDQAVRTQVTHFSVTNARTSNTGFSLGNITAGNGGTKRLMLIDTIGTASGSGCYYKSKEFLDILPYPSRLWSSTLSTSLTANLTDVQPIVVLSKQDKTVGSLFVGSFSPQLELDMYDLSNIGTGYFDKIGRIFMEGSSDSIVIKSIMPNRGITSFDTASSISFNYNLGGGTNPIPSGVTLEARMSNWGTANTGSWTSITTTTDLQSLLSALTNYSSSVGFDIQFRVSTTSSSAGRYLMNISVPANIDASYNPSVGSTSLSITNSVSGTVLAGYDNTNPLSPILKDSKTLTTSSGSVSLPYDFDNTTINYRLIARKQGYGFINITAGYNALAQSIPVTQLQVLDTSSNPLYISGVTGVSINHSTQTITVSSNMSLQELWSACQDNLCLLENLTYSDFFVTSNGSSYTSSYDIVLNNSTVSGSATLSMPSKTLSFVGNGAANIIYTDISGTNAKLSVLGLSSSAIYLMNNVGSQVDYHDSYTGTYVYYTKSTDTGTWSYKVAKYGYLSATTTFSPNGGVISNNSSLSTDTGITQATVGTVLSYTTLENPDKIYDYAAYYETTNAGIPYTRPTSKAGIAVDFGSKNLTIDATLGSVYSYSGGDVSVKAGSLSSGTTFSEVTTAGTVYTSNGATISLMYNDSLGRHVYYTLTNVVSNSRVQIYNTSDSTEVYNGIVTGTSLIVPAIWTSNKNIRVRAVYCIGTFAYDPYENSGNFTSSGFSMGLNQIVDDIYNNLVIDGSTITECSADYPNVFIDLSDPDGTTTIQRIYAWYHSLEYTADGIRNFFGGLDAEDDANYKIDTSRLNLKLFNVNSEPVILTGARLYRSDNTTVIASGSGSIQLDPSKAYIAVGSTPATPQQVWEYADRTLTQTIPTAAQNASAVRTELATELGRIDVAISSRNAIAPDNSSIAAIKTKTDNLPADTELELDAIKTNTNLIPATV